MNLELRDIRKAYGAHVMLDGFSHVFPEGRVTAILGPSGCGKTTLLRLVAGLEAPDAGAILGVPAGGLSMVFQEDRLPPQLDAADCLRCVLKRTADREARIRDALDALGLGDADGQPVREFSGGMRRRVALARALLFPSPLVLLDEPFKAWTRTPGTAPSPSREPGSRGAPRFSSPTTRRMPTPSTPSRCAWTRRAEYPA